MPPKNQRIRQFTCNWILDNPAYTSRVSEDFNDGVDNKAPRIEGPAGLVRSVPLRIADSKSRSNSSDRSCLLLLFCGLHGIVRAWIMQLIQKDKAVFDITHQTRQNRKTPTAWKDDVWALWGDIAAQIQNAY